MAIESEIKFMLEQGVYATLIQWAHRTGAFIGAAEQTNHYFDTPSHTFADNKVMLRIRSKSGGRWIMAYKRRLERGDPGQHSVEIEADLDEALAKSLIKSPSGILEMEVEPVRALRQDVERLGAVMAGYCQVGMMVTDRTRIKSPSGLYIIELDRSSYCGVEDYELECEGEDTAAAELEMVELLNGLGVSHAGAASPKFARLLEAC